MIFQQDTLDDLKQFLLFLHQNTKMDHWHFPNDNISLLDLPQQLSIQQPSLQLIETVRLLPPVSLLSLASLSKPYLPHTEDLLADLHVLTDSKPNASHQSKSKHCCNSHSNHSYRAQPHPQIDSQPDSLGVDLIRRQNENLKESQGECANTKKKKSGCTCKKTKCLKMYCECFSVGKLCTAQCACIGCENHSDHFNNQLKGKPQTKTKAQTNNRHTKVACNCKKTNCQKKYCQCFNAGVQCTQACNCCDCHNKGPGSFGQSKPFEPMCLVNAPKIFSQNAV